MSDDVVVEQGGRGGEDLGVIVGRYEYHSSGEVDESCGDSEVTVK
jgi:hypothetical protein